MKKAANKWKASLDKNRPAQRLGTILLYFSNHYKILLDDSNQSNEVDQGFKV